MYGISTLSKPSMDFVGRVSSSTLNRSKCFSIAVAYVVSQSLPLPVEKVEELTHYYRLQYESTVLSQLDKINELMPFDAKATKELVLGFYRLRYRMAHPPIIPLALRAEHALEDFFGMTQSISEDTLCTIKENSEKLTQLISGLQGLLADMKIYQDKMINANRSEEIDHYVA